MAYFLDLLIVFASVGLFVLYVFCFVRIFKKAGLGWWGLASIIPPMVLPLLVGLAFADWPTVKTTARD